MQNWVNWMLSECKKYQNWVDSGKISDVLDSTYLPAISFNKKSQVFSLYFYQDKSSYISKVFFEWDGGDFLPQPSDCFIISKSDGSRVYVDYDFNNFELVKIVFSFFSLNRTYLLKAIHARHNHKVILLPKVAALKKEFFGQRQVRLSSSRRSLSYEQFKSFVLDSEELLSFVKQAASSYDLSCFTEFFSAFKEKSGFVISFDKLYSFFAKLVLDFQS